MTALHPDHLRLLSLALAANKLRDDRKAWRDSTVHAAEAHATACNQLWEELERQLALQDGRVPVAELPIVKQRRMAAQMRSEIVEAVQGAIIDALEDLRHGPLLEDQD